MSIRVVLAISSALVVLPSCGGKGKSTPQTVAPSEASDRESMPPEAEAHPKKDPPPAIAVAEPREPNPYVAPLLRQAGDLTIEAPPRGRSDDFRGRLRTHVEGALSKGSPRVWVGPQVPGFVPIIEGTQELFLLDRVGDEFMAFYRDPYGASSCGLGADANCDYSVRLYDVAGEEQWSVALGPLLSRPTYLEVQDIRYADGMLYFNEACQSYASGAKGQCSALVAYDPKAGELRWRTRPLVSNGDVFVSGDYIVSGYGFTGERDYLFVVRRSDGKIMQKVAVPKAAQTFTRTEDGLLEVSIYPGTRLLFEMRGWDTGKPKLVRTKRKPAPGRITTGRS